MARLTRRFRQGKGGLFNLGKNLSHVTSRQDPTSDIYSTTSGHLTCYACESLWCPHVEKMIRDWSDSRALFNDLKEHGMHWVQVPVFPNEGVFAKLYLDPLRTGDAIVHLNAQPDFPPAKLNLVDEAGPNLGILCKGEGRMVLRSMVIDWITMMRDTPGDEDWTKSCLSLQHSRLRHIELKNRLNDPKLSLVEFWSILWYNKCYKCLVETGPQSGFDPDLIPER